MSYVISGTLNADIYQKESLQKRLIPFIRAHNVPVKFWPNLASCHYARSTMEWFDANGVDKVEKDMDPHNCPQFRPIDKYWANVMRMIKKNGRVVSNTAQMRNKWNQTAEK